ncbi:hypothetical protein B296_00013832 [Ensete ventricosum]|uniref:Uncharacterized protein n=1 Tax=Ensete ventricosum TaxID=4639 RepID=A0A426ZQH2_ENSVE|nr:hypothetical protein B296_00013832 [Ensete ventricosum]
MDPGSNLGIRPRFGDAVGAHQEFAKTSPKVSGRSLGTRWEITADDSEPPRMAAELPIPCFQGAFDGYIVDTNG